MNVDVQTQLKASPIDIDFMGSDTVTTDLLKEYKAIAIKLSLYADAVPETYEIQKSLEEKEVLLLDRQAALLETALSRPVTSLDDAIAVLALWHHDVVISQTHESLTAADVMVNSVYTYLKNSRVLL